MQWRGIKSSVALCVQRLCCHRDIIVIMNNYVSHDTDARRCRRPAMVVSGEALIIQKTPDSTLPASAVYGPDKLYLC